MPPVVSLSAGSAVAGVMAPARPKPIRFAPGVLFAAIMASRSEMTPSAPGSTSKCAIEVVSPSNVSDSVSAPTSVVAAATTFKNAEAEMAWPTPLSTTQR